MELFSFIIPEFKHLGCAYWLYTKSVP
uniref:Uncharacterized protein n=1 Tax=Rhizophora mucronata TaxID=61149 RepID=A0A2P2NSB4_RHIMU